MRPSPSGVYSQLGVRYMYGRGVPVDYAQGLHWLRLAAAQHDGEAKNDIGFAYYQGRGVPKDFAAALHWYGLSLADGYVAVENNIGLLYERGDGVPVDRGTAFGWLALAAAFDTGSGARVAYDAAVSRYSTAERTAGRAFAQAFADEYARRTGTLLALPPP